MAQNDSLLDSTRFSDTQRYSEAKLSRKETEDHYKQLANRIAFLKQEEVKILKHLKKDISLTQELASRHCRHSSLILQKTENMKKKSATIQSKAQENKQIRYTHKEKLDYKYRELRNKSLKNAELIKECSIENEEIITTRRLEDKLHKLNLKQKQFFDKKKTEEKKKLDFLRKRAEAKAEVERKINEEHLRKIEAEEKIKEMQMKEMEIIQALEATQLLQRSIYENIEQETSIKDF